MSQFFSLKLFAGEVGLSAKPFDMNFQFYRISVKLGSLPDAAQVGHLGRQLLINSDYTRDRRLLV